MFTAAQIPVTPSLARVSVKLPLNILLAVPKYYRSSDLFKFNLPSAVSLLMRGYGDWSQITKVLNPRIWTSDLAEDLVSEYITTPFRDSPVSLEDLDLHPERILAHDFPGSGKLRNLSRPNYPHYAIIHFVGKVASLTGTPGLNLGKTEPRVLRPRTLQAALVAAQTRLLILQVSSEDISEAQELGKSIVDNGGPAVLVVQDGDTQALEEYFTGVYANIIHKGSLPDLARPEGGLDKSLIVSLLYGKGEEDVFHFKPWITSLSKQLGSVRQIVNRHDKDIKRLQVQANTLLHPQQIVALKLSLHLGETSVGELGDHINLLTRELLEVREGPWGHEREGVQPLSELAEAIPVIKTEAKNAGALYPELRQEIENQARRAPRVLNANFADSAQQRVLEPNDGLVAGQEYDLLVDVGPRWNTIKSLVTGQSDFPEYALPPDQEGNIMQVVVVSEDFSPNMVSAQIWLPRQTGRSFPFENGQHAEKPGPVALHLQAPMLPPDSDTKTIIARARLCLYYENNLLQSAVVKAGVVREEGTRLEEANTIYVDYVLTSTFQQVEERFAKRAVRFTPAEDSNGHPVKLNVTLNDDGSNRHRIIITHLIESDDPINVPDSDCPPRGWVPYDSTAAIRILEKSRDKLQGVFFQKIVQKVGNKLVVKFVRDGEGNSKPWDFQKNHNGKNLEQFKADLADLALWGSDLYSMAFHDVDPNPEGGSCIPGEWMQNMEEALTKASVIQVARTSTTSTKCAFPWAMLYSYPILSTEYDELQYCPIVDKEWANGIRLDSSGSTCRYDSESWHAQNIICPYGFWGLKHIIEQPPSVLIMRNNHMELREEEKDIRTSAKVGLSIGVTRDPKIDAKRINDHLAKLGQLDRVHINPLEPAEDWDAVRNLLTAPEVVYFLCHGLHDDTKNTTCLSIGPHNATQPPTVFSPFDLNNWGRERKPNGPNYKEWKRRRPLIFINGCHTADLKPGETLDFVQTFIDWRASGILGTEVSIDVPVAIEVAELLFAKLTELRQGKPVSAGQALYEIRWELANKGNLLGLAYTLWALTDLRVVPE